MKKILGILVLIMIGMMGVVSAFEGTVIVNNQPIVFTLTPNTLDFGSIIPGETNPSTFPIVFQVTSANVPSVTIDVTSVEGSTVLNNIKVSNNAWVTERPIQDLAGTIDCVNVDGLCTYPTSLTWLARLTVPLGTPSGTYTQTITYTINGAPPAEG
jgi:hypothetical protein